MDTACRVHTKIKRNFCEWDVWEAVPYGEVCCPLLLQLIWYSLIATADTARRVPTIKNKHFLYIRRGRVPTRPETLSIYQSTRGKQTYPNNTQHYKFGVLRVEALDRPLIPNYAFRIPN